MCTKHVEHCLLFDDGILKRAPSYPSLPLTPTFYHVPNTFAYVEKEFVTHWIV